MGAHEFPAKVLARNCWAWQAFIIQSEQDTRKKAKGSLTLGTAWWRAWGCARGSGAGHAKVGRHVAVVLALGGQVIRVESVAALVIAAHVAALGVAVEPAPDKEGASGTSSANT
jgi:hypothetical protein